MRLLFFFSALLFVSPAFANLSCTNENILLEITNEGTTIRFLDLDKNKELIDELVMNPESNNNTQWMTSNSKNNTLVAMFYYDNGYALVTSGAYPDRPGEKFVAYLALHENDFNMPLLNHYLSKNRPDFDGKFECIEF